MIGSVQHMISLLILHELRAAAVGSTCLTADQVKAREDRFEPYLKKLDHQRHVREQQQQHLATCGQAAREMHALSGRALSPWMYYVDHDDSRYPPDITFAKCLCTGCIIKGSEDHSYNSVLLMAPQLVLIKTKCKDGTNTYWVKKTRIDVPVGCTCARPISGN
ncbi:interleukin-17C-like [Archocentrus centrarchus]|uniref:interleukin-17C-like n=1 Tax=Archocentrus centrarchus TaxID=63155 RepID=UPI0011EA1DC4|nr:interleukin-17C-like [Archocentrus centrarchus]